MSDFNYEGMEELDKYLKVFFKKELFERDLIHDVLNLADLSFTEAIIEDRNWNHEWETGFKPVIISDYAAIRANFHNPIYNVEHEIIITPKMSFGTGHHATTSLMIQTIREMDIAGKSALDFGTGTGVLAILLSKLGASTIIAIDNDEWSITNASENFSENNIENVELVKADSLREMESFQLILANINLNVLIQSEFDINRISQPGSKILLSGFYDSDAVHLLEFYNVENYKLLNRKTQNEWCCILLEKL